MPPSSGPSAVKKLDRLLERSLARLLYSPSCTRLQAKSRGQTSSNTSQRRQASTLTSSTAINGTKHIPPRYRALHAALLDVQMSASAQVNLPRLQLALQGLESESPPTRVAVLGHNIPDTAQKVVRLLLADALEAEGAWEKELWEGNQKYSNGLLIRFGYPPNASLPQPRTSIPIMYVPSNILQRKNVEILISAVYGDSDNVPDGPVLTSDAYLSPIVGTPTSASGREVLIRQPVHQTLLVVTGLDGFMAITTSLANTKFTSKLEKEMISVAVNLPGNSFPRGTASPTMIDTESAEQGLSAIRKSPTLASIYEHKWNTSGLPTVSEWLTTACTPATKLNLISSLLASTSTNLATQKLVTDTKASSQSLSSATRANLDSAITQFSLAAHTELQSGLTTAWSSRNWRKLAWWKLFWRVDDVGLIVSDLVTNAWLCNTEKAVYELSGRLRQVGIEPVEELIPEVQVTENSVHDAAASATAISSGAKWQSGGMTIPPEVPYPSERQVHPQYTSASTAPVINIAPMTSTSPARAYSSDARPVLTSPDGAHVELRMQAPPQPIALSTIISRVRTQTMAFYISDLTVTAQQLVLRTLSISGLSAGLSGLLYFNIDGGLYEAGTVAALGTAYALRKMQGDWLERKRVLEHGLLGEGREVVRRVEGGMRKAVEQQGRVRGDEVEEGIWRRAETAVGRAMGELQRLTEGGDMEGKEKEK